jgi:aryl-alcohol dehydrogenase-like predicted oxidoreductase
MIPKLPFGRSGHDSPRLLFGAAALGSVSQADADRTLGLVLDSGVDHLDTAASYGAAEERMGPWLAAHRNEVFLATKTEKRSKSEALAELERSLRLLRTDHVDLWQMHVLVKEDEWETAMGEGGALEAFVEARRRGLVRFLGVTGHGKAAPAMHLRSLEEYDFDSVLFPWNWQLSRDPAYAATVRTLVHICGRRGVAVQLIKAFCRRPWGARERSRATWYEPLEEAADIARALAWAWEVPGAFVNSAGDIDLLPPILAAAGSGTASGAATEPHDDAAMSEMAARLEMADLFA